jgi:putative MFS transporter
VPIDQALVTEYAPAGIRGRVASMLPMSWPMGYFCAAGAALALVPHVGWRWLFAIGVLPALLAFLIRRKVPESPRWLAAHGRHEEARASLAYVGVTDADLAQARNQVAAMPARPAVPEATFGDLFTAAYTRRIVHTWTLWFCSNFAATGFSVWLPTIYSTYYHIELSRTLFYTFIVAGTQVVARLCAVGIVDVIGRRRMIVLGYGIAGVAALGFTQATTEMSLLLTAMTYAFFQDMGSLAMTVYTPEVYPVRIRGKGTALAMGWGRFGGMASPMIAGVLIGLGSLTLVWCIIAGGMLLASGLTFLLAYETRGNLELVARGEA